MDIFSTHVKYTFVNEDFFGDGTLRRHEERGGVVET